MTRMRRTTDWLRDHLMNEADKIGGNCELCGPATYDEVQTNALSALCSIGMNGPEGILNKCLARFKLGYARYERFLGVDQDVGYATRASLVIARYARTLNAEYLIDALNYILRELQHSSWPGVEYHATDHDEGKDAKF